MSALVRYEAARTALAEAHRVDEVKDIRDKAEAMAAYARQAKDSELIQYATEIKVRAERRCGELLRVTEKHQGGRPRENQSHDTTGFAGVEILTARPAPTLSDMGLTKDESSRYQQLAAMPAEHFETAVATAKATAGEVTTAFMLREASKHRPAAKRLTPAAQERLDRLEAAKTDSTLCMYARQTLAALRSRDSLTTVEIAALVELAKAIQEANVIDER